MKNYGLPVVEIFGPTLQGEGPGSGLNAAFLRFGGCNLSCSWCDTPYSWDGSRFDLRREISFLTLRQIMEQLPDATICVLTGGEPLLHQNNPVWNELLAELVMRYRWVHLETNGTIAPSLHTVKSMSVISVSPKLAHAGTHRGRQDPTMYRDWARVGAAIVKIVVRNSGDVADAVELATHYGWDRSRIWVMPEGTSAAVLNERWPDIASAAAKFGINATHRLHVLAWADERAH